MFFWGDGEGSFFVTAAHVLEGIKGGDIIGFAAASGFVDIGVREVARADNADVVVFSTGNIHLEGKFDGIVPEPVTPGCEVMFVGFPHGLVGSYPGSRGWLTGLVRKASFSGVIEPPGWSPILVLDGFNNPGFSGSPVFGPTEGAVRPIGVISGYRPESPAHGGVYRNVDGNEERVPGLFTKANSGMIYAYTWKQVTEALSKLQSRNPGGAFKMDAIV